MTSSARRTLTLVSTPGLGNRLRALLSAMAVAEATGRDLRVHWPRNTHCGASFQDLFTHPLNVSEAPFPDMDAAGARDFEDGGRMDLLRADEPDLTIRAVNWIFYPELFPGHDALKRRAGTLMDELRPVPAIEARIAEFRSSRFRPTMIGVHVRRGDYFVEYPMDTVPTCASIRDVRRLLRQFPEAGVLLCSDDGAILPGTGRESRRENVERRFARAFGERLVTTRPSTLDRKSPEAIRDAVVDLWLLRSTQAFAGNRSSSFSQLAVFGRTVPCAWGRQGSFLYRTLYATLRYSGLGRLLRWDIRRRLGRDYPLHLIIRHYRKRLPKKFNLWWIPQ